MAQQSEEYRDPGQDWDTVLARYGEAMLRAGKLEEEVNSLQRMVEPLQGQRDGDPGLVAQLEEKDQELRRREETAAALRVQISALAAELEQTKGNLRQGSNGNYAHIQRRRHRPWWQFWRRRHRRSYSSSAIPSP